MGRFGSSDRDDDHALTARKNGGNHAMAVLRSLKLSGLSLVFPEKGKLNDIALFGRCNLSR